jgi:sec-independent protein translocase protein TatA
MGGLSIWHWMIVIVVLLLLFGKGRFSDMMGDVAKGLKSFKKGMSDEEDAATRTAEPPRRLSGDAPGDPGVGADRRGSTLEVPVDRSRDIDPLDRREP